MLEKSIKKHLTKLHQKKYRKEYNEFIVEGLKGVEEALRSDAEINFIIIEDKRKDEAEFKKIVEKTKADIHYCARKDIGEIKTTDTFPGVLAVVRQSEVELDTSKPIICLDGIKDPGNLGTIIRTADWFGVVNILLSEDCVDLYNEKVVRGSMGSIFHVNALEVNNIIAELENLTQAGYNIVCLTMTGKNINKLKPKDKTIYVFGSESHGIREEILEMGEQYSISGEGQAESLNVGVSVGVVLSKI